MLKLSRRNVDLNAVAELYKRVVDQARLPVFYTSFGVPDTVDGRFELIVLHAAMVFRRLKDETDAADFAQTLFDYMFADMDRSLREQGVGDLSVGKHVKRMAQGFYGRTVAYDRALSEQDDEKLLSAVVRNIYGTVAVAPAVLPAMTRYIKRQATQISSQPVSTIMSADLHFSSEEAILGASMSVEDD